jgi:hypothetical protein
MLNAPQIVTDLQTETSLINVASIQEALQNVASTTFATLTQASPIKTALKLNQNFFKITVQNVVLNNGGSSLYTNAVNKELNASQEDVQEAFKALASHYEQVNGSYSVCALKSDTSKHYLRAVVNKALEVIFFDANKMEVVTREHVASFLAPAASKKLLETKKTTYVQHSDISHKVIVRTFALKNIHSLNINKQKLSCK